MKRFNPLATVGATPTPEPYTPPPVPPAIEARRREQEEREWQRTLLFVEHYGQPGAAPVVVPHGMMAVTLSLKFDNSDTMTDYFDRHAPYSPDFLLLVAKQQAKTEKLARRALGLVPELEQRHEWKWRTENYSMGHGNYLQSSGFELPAPLQGFRNVYCGGPVTHGHWEIEFSRPYREGSDLKILPHAGYGRTVNVTPPTAPTASAPITLSINRQRNLVELRFSDKPSEALRAEMKAARWRWFGPAGCWYHQNTPQNHAWAVTFIERHSKPTVALSAPVSPTPLIAPPSPRPANPLLVRLATVRVPSTFAHS
jgi:hypothetical protein